MNINDVVYKKQRDLHRQIQHTPLLEESELVATLPVNDGRGALKNLSYLS